MWYQLVGVREYLTDGGGSPFGDWFAGLDGRAAAKVTTVLARIAAGNFSEVKGVGGGVFERRIDYGPGYRVYFGKEGKTIIVLLGGGTKQRQPRDIEAALGHWRAYKERREAKS